MSQQTLGFLIGGIIPAVLFGVSGIFTKASNDAGIGTGVYLMIAGLAVTVVGLGAFLLQPDTTLSMRSGTHAFLMGFTWALGAFLVAFALTKFGTPISQLVPLYNMNTLVAVLLALVVFAEWKQVKSMQLAVGALLIIAGSVVVSRS